MFDYSCGHKSVAPDALVASRLNRRPGGKQPAMKDTVWGRKPQKLVQDNGTPKGAELVLQEKGINTSRLKLEQMQIILANLYHFKDEVSSLETMLTSKGHTAMFLPKFHCELNGISGFGVIVNISLGRTVTTPLLHFVKMCHILLTPSQLKQLSITWRGLGTTCLLT